MKDAPTLTEQELIRKLKEGSRKAFDAIYRMYARRLLAYCKEYTKSMEDAEEKPTWLRQDILQVPVKIDKSVCGRS